MKSREIIILHEKLGTSGHQWGTSRRQWGSSGAPLGHQWGTSVRQWSTSEHPGTSHLVSVPSHASKERLKNLAEEAIQVFVCCQSDVKIQNSELRTYVTLLKHVYFSVFKHVLH